MNYSLCCQTEPWHTVRVRARARAAGSCGSRCRRRRCAVNAAESGAENKTGLCRCTRREAFLLRHSQLKKMHLNPLLPNAACGPRPNSCRRGSLRSSLLTRSDKHRKLGSYCGSLNRAQERQKQSLLWGWITVQFVSGDSSSSTGIAHC